MDAVIAAGAAKVALHGAGCAYSAAITAWLARGQSRIEAVEAGQKLHHPAEFMRWGAVEFPDLQFRPWAFNVTPLFSHADITRIIWVYVAGAGRADH